MSGAHQPRGARRLQHQGPATEETSVSPSVSMTRKRALRGWVFWALRVRIRYNASLFGTARCCSRSLPGGATIPGFWGYSGADSYEILQAKFRELSFHALR